MTGLADEARHEASQVRYWLGLGSRGAVGNMGEELASLLDRLAEGLEEHERRLAPEAAVSQAKPQP